MLTTGSWTLTFDQDDEDEVEYVGFGLMPSHTLANAGELSNSSPTPEQFEQDHSTTIQTDKTAAGSPKTIHSPRQALLAAVENFFMPQLSASAHSAQQTHSRNSSACTMTPKAYAHEHDSFSSGSHTSSTPLRSSFTSTSSYEPQPERITNTTPFQCQQQEVLQDTAPGITPYYLQPVRYSPGIDDPYYQTSAQNLDHEVPFDACQDQRSYGPSLQISPPYYESGYYEQQSNMMAVPTATQLSHTFDQRRSSFRVSPQDARVSSSYGLNDGPLVDSTMGAPFRDERTGTFRLHRLHKHVEYGGKRRLFDWQQEWQPAVLPRSFKIDTRGFPITDELQATLTTEMLAEAVSIGPLESIVFSPSPINRTAFTLITFVYENHAATFWNLVTEAYSHAELMAFEAGRHPSETCEGLWAKQVEQEQRVIKEEGATEATMTLMQPSKDQGQLFIHSKPATVTRLTKEGGPDRGPDSKHISRPKHSTRIIVIRYPSATQKAPMSEVSAEGNNISGSEARAEQGGHSGPLETPISKSLSKPGNGVCIGFQGERDLKADIERILRSATTPKASASLPLNTCTNLITKFEVFGSGGASEPLGSEIQHRIDTKSGADAMEEQGSVQDSNVQHSQETHAVRRPTESGEDGRERTSRKSVGATEVVIHFANITDAIRTKRDLMNLPKYSKNCTISFGKERHINAKQFRERRLRQACDHLAGKIADLRAKKAEGTDYPVDF